MLLNSIPCAPSVKHILPHCLRSSSFFIAFFAFGPFAVPQGPLPLPSLSLPCGSPQPGHVCSCTDYPWKQCRTCGTSACRSSSVDDTCGAGGGGHGAGASKEPLSAYGLREYHGACLHRCGGPCASHRDSCAREIESDL